jgi:hypothetical protein
MRVRVLSDAQADHTRVGKGLLRAFCFPKADSVGGTGFRQGYSTGVPDARLRGGFWALGQMALMVSVAVWGVELVLAWK